METINDPNRNSSVKNTISEIQNSPEVTLSERDTEE